MSLENGKYSLLFFLSKQEEKESFENNLKQTSQDRDKLREERDQALADRQKVTTEKMELVLKQEEVHLKHQTLMDQIEKEAQARTEVLLYMFAQFSVA